MEFPDQLFNANGSYGCGATSEPDFARASDLITFMDRLGIQRSLVYSVPARDQSPVQGNRRLLEEISQDEEVKQRLLPSFVISPTMLYERGAMEFLMNSMVKQQVRALRLFPSALRYPLYQLEPLLEQVSQSMPVLFISLREGVDMRDLIDLAGRFPQIPVVCTEGMWGHMPALFDLMRRCANVLIETSWIHSWGTLEQLTQHFRAERLVFGVGYSSHQGASIAGLAYANLRDSEKELIAYQNLDRLLGIPSPGHPSVIRNPQSQMTVDTYWSRFMRGSL